MFAEKSITTKNYYKTFQKIVGLLIPELRRTTLSIVFLKDVLCMCIPNAACHAGHQVPLWKLENYAHEA